MERPIRIALLIALILRLGLAWFSVGFEHPNEFSRTLEPIAASMGYSAHLPWEWEKGLLSPIPVALQGAVIRIAESAFHLDPLGSSRVLRIWVAILSLLPILCGLKILHSFRAPPWAMLSLVLYLGFWPEFLFHSVRLMDYAWESSFFALAVWLALEKRKIFFFLSGLVLSLAFFFRPQSGLEFLALGAFLFLILENVHARILGVAYLSCGYLVGLLAFGGMDAWSSGEGFLDPFSNYWKFNFTEGGAALHYGEDHWHRYFTETAKILGWVPFLTLFLGTLFHPVSRKIGILFFLPFFVLCFVSHKEGRFLLGFLWVLVPAGMIALSAFADKIGERNLKTLGFFVGLSAIMQMNGTFSKSLLRSHVVKEFNRLGQELNPNASGSIAIVGDPDFLPGGFFLRTHLPLRFVDSANGSGAPIILQESSGGSWTLVGQ